MKSVHHEMPSVILGAFKVIKSIQKLFLDQHGYLYFLLDKDILRSQYVSKRFLYFEIYKN